MTIVPVETFQSVHKFNWKPNGNERVPHEVVTHARERRPKIEEDDRASLMFDANLLASKVDI